MRNPIVTFETNQGTIKAELFPDVAPNTVNNFISLVKRGFYDGLIFHRVIPGFMIQGGDPQGTGMGGPGYSIKGEFIMNNFNNELLHKRGVLSMARSQSPNSAGSQFFIMVDDAPHLNAQYASFGQVIEGMEAVDKIVAAQRDYNDRPLENQIMEKVTVETFGVDYPEPEKVRSPF
ncbi:MAG: peptidylprolyl isomerase [Acutalibacteraceae bacterium]